ncbi:hypothetical protein [Paenibacillus gansuensis]|uniref:Uncharacterized protein n=1 Tax=Paenibacillus gansuensis TaxID=306542 RepID=A0ABW5PHE8_9BACL
MEPRWRMIHDFYCILAEQDGDVILDEIVQHYNEYNLCATDKEFIVDMHSMEHDFDELLKFQRRVDYYGDLGYNILLCD